jgi:L-alanine-DL-glutamate epimerase-like enolase superfamily enzyme
MPTIKSIEARIVEIPQKVVFETARSRTEVSRAIHVAITADDGSAGLGEATPAEYVTGENTESVLDSVQRAAEELRGRDVRRWRAFCEDARRLLPGKLTACAGLEIAIVDLFCRMRSTKMAEFFGGVQDSVVSDLTIPIVPPSKAYELAREAAPVYRSLKIKVGGPDRTEDLERVRQIHLGAPRARLRIDANQAFEPDDAIVFVRKLEDLGIPLELVEQPVAKEDIQGLRYCRERIGPPVFADESARDPASVMALLKAEAVDGVNIKLMKSGFTGALDIIAMCRAAGVQLMLGCMLESPVGIGAAVHLACGTGAFSFLDLDADVLGKPTGLPQNYTREGETLRV